MRSERLLTAVLAALLAFCTALGAAGCMITGFDLTIQDGTLLILRCAAACLLCALGFSFRFGSIPLVLSGLWLLYRLLLQGELTQQFWQLVYRITHLYNNAYHWGYFQLVNTPWNAGIADLPMTVLAVLLAAVVTWTVCRQGYGIMVLTPALLPLFSCCLLTDTVPSAQALFLLLLPLVLLLLTGRVRRADPRQGNRLTLMALLPVLLVLGSLFLLTPEEGYVNRSAEFRDRVLTWFQDLSDREGTAAPQLNISTHIREPQSLNLSALGRRIESSAPVMTVTADTGGTLYLRGQDYDRYDGTGWSATDNRVEDFSAGGPDLGRVTVETANRLHQLYLPYYPQDAASLIGGRVDNSRLETSYTFSRTGLSQDPGDMPRQPDRQPDPRYLDLPESTRSRAEAILSRILSDAPTATDKAAAIAAYVRSRAAYDLDPSRMPDGQEDFALWFLEEADRGYCVHFATAATVLLRSAGIEARYVSGYMVKAPAEAPVTLTGEHAHAWAEYYEPTLGLWLVLEATPSDSPQPLPAVTVPRETSPENDPHSPTEVTVPATETTAPATEPAPAATGGFPGDPTIAASRPLPAAVKALLVFALILSVLEVQCRLRRKLRIRRRTQGPPNAQALHRWQEAALLARILKQAPPKTLEALAGKAKFSQHTLTARELQCFDSYLLQAEAELAQKPWYHKLFTRYIHGIF